MDISAGASSANLNGRKLVELNDAWLDSDLTVTLEDVGAEMEKGKVCDQFEAYHKLTGRRATYDGSLYATSLDTSKVGCKKVEALDICRRSSVDSLTHPLTHSFTHSLTP